MKYFSSVKFGIVFLMAVALASCGGGGSSGGGGGSDTGYTMKTLPSKFTVDIPKSIIGDSAGKKSPMNVAQKVISKAGAPSFSGPETMRQLTGIMTSISGGMGFFTILADGAISQNNLTADGNPHTVPVTLTQEMFDAIATIVPEGMGETDSTMASAIGHAVTVDVTYSSDEPAPYKYSVVLGMSGQSVTIYWDETKTNTKLQMGTGGNTLTFTYDDTAKLMTVSLEASTGDTIDMSIKRDGVGAFFFANGKSSAGDSFRIEGYADDNGGYTKSTLVSADFGSTVIDEAFGPSGAIIADDGTYSGVYSGGSSDIATLQGAIGLTRTTSLAAGEYLVLTASSFDGTFDTEVGDVVGYGLVSGTTLTIQDIGGAAYTETGTVYLYKVDASTPFFNGSVPTIGTVANAVTL